MNCLEFRRVCQAAPNELSAEARAHRSECASCARFAERTQDFDQRLAAALRVPAPESMGAHIIFERSLRGRRRFLSLAAAAVVVLAASGVFGALTLVGDRGFANDVVAHLDDHPLHHKSVQSDARERLAAVGQTLNVAFHPELEDVVNAALCDVDGHKGAHFVLNEQGMRATAFVMPGLTMAQAGMLEKGGMQGLFLQTPEGVIAVFCPEREMLVALSEKVRRAVKWGSA